MSLDRSFDDSPAAGPLASVPSLSPVLRDFQPTVDATHCTFAPRAELWGGPRWERRLSLEVNLADQFPILKRFTQVFLPAKLDGFVIGPRLKRPPRTVEEVGRVTRDILTWLSDEDPAEEHAMSDLVQSPGWQFRFNAVPMFVTVFSDVYPVDHVRHSPDATFLMLQPTASFDHHGIGSRHPHSTEIKQNIRDDFEENRVPYPLDAIKRRIEAHLYVLPLAGDEAFPWWEPDARHGQVVLF